MTVDERSVNRIQIYDDPNIGLTTDETMSSLDFRMIDDDVAVRGASHEPILHRQLLSRTSGFTPNRVPIPMSLLGNTNEHSLLTD